MEKNYHTDNKSFMIYKDWEDFLAALENDEQVGQLFKALFAFAKRGEEAEFNGALKMAFIVMRNAIERDGEKWEETCSARSEAGKQGGRPRKAKEAKKAIALFESKSNQAKAKEADKDKDKDTDTDTDKEIDIKTACGVPSSPVRCFGEFQHIKLTDEQHSKLVSEYGESVIAECIERMDSYLEQIGKPNKYKNFYAAIKNWIKKDSGNKPNNAPLTPDDYTRGHETEFLNYGL